MFGIRELKRRIKSLEEKELLRSQKEFCAKDIHDWETVKNSYSSDPPFIRCKQCYARPKVTA